jgi:hypothetical protein
LPSREEAVAVTSELGPSENPETESESGSAHDEPASGIEPVLDEIPTDETIQPAVSVENEAGAASAELASPPTDRIETKHRTRAAKRDTGDTGGTSKELA